jgi:hypothetical protein
LEQKGAIVVENLDISISESAIRAEEETPGEPADAVVWEDLEQSAGEETRLSVTYLCFMIVATMIAGTWRNDAPHGCGIASPSAGEDPLHDTAG